jgi:hypothetical protein
MVVEQSKKLTHSFGSVSNVHEWHIENQPTDDEHDRVEVLQARILHNGCNHQIDGDEQHDHWDHKRHLQTASFCECDQRETLPGGRSH